jgi:DNA polymerase-3 subunit alpha
MKNGATLQSDKQKGQMNFFGQLAGGDDYANDADRLPDVPPWPEPQMLAFEKAVLGFYVTSNPLSQHAEILNIYSTTNAARLGSVRQDAEVVMGGMIAKMRFNVIKNGRQAGKKMAVFTLEDLQGAVDVVVFPGELEKYGDLIAPDQIVFVKAKADQTRERPQLLTDEIIAMDEVTEKLAARVAIKFDSRAVTADRIQEIKSLCEHHRGRSSLFVAIHSDKGKVYANADQKLRVNPTVEFCKKMKQLVGEENMVLTK